MEMARISQHPYYLECIVSGSGHVHFKKAQFFNEKLLFESESQSDLSSFSKPIKRGKNYESKLKEIRMKEKLAAMHNVFIVVDEPDAKFYVQYKTGLSSEDFDRFLEDDCGPELAELDDDEPGIDEAVYSMGSLIEWIEKIGQ